MDGSNEAVRRFHARRPLTDSLTEEGSRLVSNASHDDGARELLPARRFEWERVVRRVKMRRGLKLIVLALGSYASSDGSRVRPGRDRLANVCGLTPRSVSRALIELRDMGFIERISEGFRYGRQGRADEYRLTLPSNLLETIPMLDPDDGTGDGSVTSSRSEPVTPTSHVPSGTSDIPDTELVTSQTEPVTSQTGTGDTGVTLQVHDQYIDQNRDKTSVGASVTSGASGLDGSNIDEAMAEWEKEVADTWSPSPPCECREGWLGYDHDGRPIPCPRCKPHLRPVPNEGVA